jgi:hypothetical protein
MQLVGRREVGLGKNSHSNPIALGFGLTSFSYAVTFRAHQRLGGWLVVGCACRCGYATLRSLPYEAIIIHQPSTAFPFPAVSAHTDASDSALKESWHFLSS